MNRRLILAAAALVTATSVASAGQMTITPQGERAPARGAADYFTGEVTVTPIYPASEFTGNSGGLVEFSAGARSAWHTHPAGQTLVVTAGTGWIQQEGGEKREIRPGDVIWTPPGVKHWHGASSGAAMSHIAITNVKDGKFVDWMEQVTNEEYLD